MWYYICMYDQSDTLHGCFLCLQLIDLSFYDVVLDFVLLDAFDDLATPPYSVATAVQNRWLSARIKETVSDSLLLLHPIS